MSFLLNVFSTLFMTGLIWFVQVVHYPLFNSVGVADFASYEKRHSDLTTYVVVTPMFVELITAALLAWQRPDFISGREAWLGLGLVGIIWLSTALLQVPQHSILGAGFNDGAHGKLVATNWVRTVAWSARALLITLWLKRLLP